MRLRLSLLLLFAAILQFPTAQAQQWEFDQLNQFLRDSNYVEALRITKKLAPTQLENKQLQSIHVILKMRNKEWSGMCEAIENCRNAGGYMPPYIKRYYQKYFCVANKSDLPKDFKKMYSQKNQNEQNGYKTIYTPTDSLRGTLNHWRSSYNVHYYDLTVRFDVKKHTISGISGISFTLTDTTSFIQVDADKQLIIDSVLYSGKKLPFQRKFNAFFVTVSNDWKVSEKYQINVFYHGKPAKAKQPPWEGGFVWKSNKSSSVWAGVACEHLGGSFWWPSKDHPSDEPDSMRLHYEVPKPFKAIANANLESETDLPNEYSRFNWLIKNPINLYNVTFYIGNYVRYDEEYQNESGKHTLKFYVMPHNLNKAKPYFGFSKEVITFFEKAFGEYPFWSDGFALVESPFAGMEHQSAIAIGGDYGKTKKAELAYYNVKDDYLIIHESAHEWWGNSVTASDMADAWLQEGFATYAELLFIENKYGPTAYVNELDYKRLFILNLWPIVGNKGVNDNSFIGGDIYNKGALFLQNLRASIFNDSLFYATIKSFCVNNRHKTVSTQDFLLHVNAATGKDFTLLFDTYLNKIEIPTLEYDYVKDSKGEYKFLYRWINAPKGFTMPFAVKLPDQKFIRLEASTEWGDTKIPKTKFFQFVDLTTGMEGCPSNYYTYHYTKAK